MSELKFYLCNTPEGQQLVHLQADAKRIDPKYQTVLIDTSKQALMDRLNGLMRQAGGTPAPVDEVEEGAPAPPPPPKTPTYQPSMPPTTARSVAQTAWEEFIFDIPVSEAFRLDSLERTIAARRAEIAGEPQAEEAAPVRRKGWKKA